MIMMTFVNYYAAEKLLFNFKMRQEEKFCCLRRLPLSHSKFCGRGRFSSKNRPTRIGGAETRTYFNEYVGTDAIIFMDNDEICKTCFWNVSFNLQLHFIMP